MLGRSNAKRPREQDAALSLLAVWDQLTVNEGAWRLRFSILGLKVSPLAGLGMHGVAFCILNFPP